MADPETGPLVLFHVSDLHFGYEDRAALDWFMAEVVRERPALVICTGDLTMRGTAREFAMAREWLEQLPVPVLLEPGNHDVPYYWFPLRRVFSPYARFRALRAAVEGQRSLPGVAVVSLKTVGRAQLRLNWSKGRIREAELAETLRGLAGHSACPLKLVTCHHPLVDAGTEGSGSTRGGHRALAALARAGADAVLSGHVHDAFDLTIEADGLSIRMIGAGTLSQRLRRTRPSYNRLEWSVAGGLQVCGRTMS
jgi:3',5'-cyclic AMP phosphodiesterase CpdA